MSYELILFFNWHKIYSTFYPRADQYRRQNYIKHQKFVDNKYFYVISADKPYFIA